MKVNINDIKINPGRRSVSQDGIEELAFSIEEIGLLNPITLTADHTLVAGLHRLEAVKSLGWSEIECTITGLNGLTAQLAELDENFARTNLSPLELGDLLRQRKDIYEELYPETKAGVAQAIGRNKAKGKSTDCNLQSKKPFIEDTADLTGQHPSTISRHIKVASELTPEAKGILKGAAKPVPHSTLSKISKLIPEQQKEVSTLLVSGEIKSVDEYLARQAPATSDSKVKADIPDEDGISPDMLNYILSRDEDERIELLQKRFGLIENEARNLNGCGIRYVINDLEDTIEFSSDSVMSYLKYADVYYHLKVLGQTIHEQVPNAYVSSDSKMVFVMLNGNERGKYEEK